MTSLALMFRYYHTGPAGATDVPSAHRLRNQRNKLSDRSRRLSGGQTRFRWIEDNAEIPHPDRRERLLLCPQFQADSASSDEIDLMAGNVLRKRDGFDVMLVGAGG